MAPAEDAKSRFTSRTNDYVNSRPSYPAEVVSLLADHFDLPQGAVIADLGSGTGISAKVFLDNLKTHGIKLYGIEPNQAMREAAESILAEQIEAGVFISLDKSAEETGLHDHSVDLVIAGQAFHWFDVDKVRKECQRILKGKNSGVALLWNLRRGMDEQSDAHGGPSKQPDFSQLDRPVMSAYDLLLQRLPTDYLHVAHHKTVSEDVLKRFYGPDGFQLKTFCNPYKLDFHQLKGRLLSSSYTPQEGEEGYEAMMKDLEELFERYQVDSKIDFVYDCQVFFGAIS